jgi:hypothetical protein
LNVLGCLSRKELTKAKALAQQEDVQRPSDKVYVLLPLLKSPLRYGDLNLNPKLHCLLACFVQGQSKIK